MAIASVEQSKALSVFVPGLIIAQPWKLNLVRNQLPFLRNVCQVACLHLLQARILIVHPTAKCLVIITTFLVRLEFVAMLCHVKDKLIQAFIEVFFVKLYDGEVNGRR